MCETILVQVDIDVWSSSVPEIRTKPILRESEKVLWVPVERKLTRRADVVRTEGVFQKNLLGRVTSARPGTKRAYFTVDAGADIRRSEEYRMAVIAMLDQIYGDLAEAGNHLAEIEDVFYKD